MTSEEVTVLQKMCNNQITLLGKQLALKEYECKLIHYRYIQTIEPSQEEVGTYYGPVVQKIFHTIARMRLLIGLHHLLVPGLSLLSQEKNLVKF